MNTVNIHKARDRGQGALLMELLALLPSANDNEYHKAGNLDSSK